MISRVVTVVILLAAGYWYWSGPYQSQRNPSAEEQLQRNIENMRECIRGKNYKAGATGVSEGDPERVCADKFHLYRYEGQWRSSDGQR